MASAVKLVKRPEQSELRTRLLTPKEAAEFLGIPEGTLAQWRSQRRGPPFLKLEGRLVRYRSRDLEQYITSCVVETTLEKHHA